jgi:hypothetical protein
VYANSDYWFLEDLPDFPYDIPPLDSLAVSIPVLYTGYGGAGMGYVYDTLFVISAPDTSTSIVAFNLEVIPGIGEYDQAPVRVFPNPSSSSFTFDLHDFTCAEGKLFLYNSMGLQLTKIDCSRMKSVTWNGLDQSGKETPPGTYFYRLVTEKEVRSGKLTKTM